MNLLDGLKVNNTVTNTKGGEYYLTSYNDNLDLFTRTSRYNPEETNLNIFKKALKEDKITALANLLYILDIREGKGERKIFKTLFKYLSENDKESALMILPYISKIGRFDYILVGIDTLIDDEVVALIKETINHDLESEEVTLLAKWLPSHRTHNKNNKLASILMKKLGMNEKEYRKTLSLLRDKINILEKNLTNKTYEEISFEKVPTKAMLKHTKAFTNHMNKEFEEYKAKVKSGNAKINTTGLYTYEIIKKIFNGENDTELIDIMWNNQKDVLAGNKTNVLVMADTSGSMTSYNALPYATSVGLALYTAERNYGYFHNYFLTFSSSPILQKVTGDNIQEKYYNIKQIVEETNIDKAFELLLTTAVDNKIKQKEMPSHIIIISDMEFDRGVYSKEGTNFKGWKKTFEEAGYTLPKIIFWNVAGAINGLPVTAYDKDVCMVSGFFTNILDNLLTLENYTPIDIMLEKLSTYIELLKGE